ncbi:MAG: nucleotidyltransferase domain-containing protein [Firmicutes bacterium]|nr:nucleotidyltransferase domain-containing protein [Bacillota bacterium]
MPKPMLEDIIQRIVRIANPERILLFGSAARGEMGPDSDLDLLVIKRGLFKRRALAQEIYMNLFGAGIPVDIIIATPDEVENYRDKVGSIIPIALSEGREIYCAQSH